jgi:hypothetical protein
MTKLGKGDKSWQRVQQLLEALLDYALNDCDRISNLHAELERRDFYGVNS